MSLKTIRVKKAGSRIMVVSLLTLLVAFSGQSLLAQTNNRIKATWQVGLTADMFNRGIKWGDQTSMLKSMNFMLEARTRNLGGFFNLSLFGGLAITNLNGVIFDRLPITLDYEAGGISGVIFGLGIDKEVLSASDWKFGLIADMTAFIGFKKTFAIEGFVLPGEATAEPDWAQASGGLFVLYDGFEKIQPFLQVAASKFWGNFKMSEKIEDLTGEESKDLKASGFLSVTLGWNISLSQRLCLIPRVRVYTGNKTAIGGGLSLFYGL